MANSPFPDPRRAPHHGLVAIGGDFSPALLLAAYARGIFPWPSEELPRAWFSPDPRMVLLPQELHIARRLRRTLARGTFRVTFDTAFPAVIQACAAVPRYGQRGTWILDEMIDGYVALHDLGFAHSVETWQGDQLVGGLYGLSLGAAFFGESMFHRVTDASKIAFVHLVECLRRWDFHFLDCQTETEHLSTLGARPWPRSRFLDALDIALREPTRRGAWTDCNPSSL